MAISLCTLTLEYKRQHMFFLLYRNMSGFMKLRHQINCACGIKQGIDQMDSFNI